MMKVLALLCLVGAALAKHEEYIGWKSYYLAPTTREQQEVIGQMQYDFDLDILSPPILEREGVVLVQPDYHDAFIKTLEEAGISYRTHREDIKAALDYDDMIIEKRSRERQARNSREMPYDSYQRMAVIDAYLESVASRYPDLVTLETAARSFEGRPINYLKISNSKFEDESKPVIFIEGGIHAREWIAPPTITYAIHKLVEDVTESDLLDKFDWILLPVSNPDGYEHSHTSFRFWRKTRSTDQHSLSPACPGVDGNRNYDFFWNTVGTSASPCADTYAGGRPFSEIETRVVRDIVNEHLHRMALYITMHSFGSMILYPWGHDGSLSQNAFALHIVGVAMGDEINNHKLANFPRYQVGNSVLVIGYAASGASEDWAHLAGVPLSYTYELPGLAGGLNGFHLDPIYIEQVAKETWEGIVAGARETANILPGIRKKLL